MKRMKKILIICTIALLWSWAVYGVTVYMERKDFVESLKEAGFVVE